MSGGDFGGNFHGAASASAYQNVVRLLPMRLPRGCSCRGGQSVRGRVRGGQDVQPCCWASGWQFCKKLILFSVRPPDGLYLLKLNLLTGRYDRHSPVTSSSSNKQSC